LTVKKGDKIAVKNKAKSLAQVKLNQQAHTEPIPDFLEIVANEPPEGMMKSIPGRGDADPRLGKDKELQEQLIIEFCSR
jgi:ribosomal protein S4